MNTTNEFGYCRYAFEEDYVHIYDLYVLPEYRRKGKARELLQITIDQIRESSWTDDIQIVAIPTEDSISRQDLIDFYKSLSLAVFEYYE